MCMITTAGPDNVPQAQSRQTDEEWNCDQVAFQVNRSQVLAYMDKLEDGT